MHSCHISTGKPIRNKLTSRGRILIFIHDITKDSFLCNFEIIKERPFEEIKRKVNNPHVNSPDIKTINEAATPLPLTSKIIWLYDSHTRDYHDNMNFKMFMKWITTKVIPLLACKYPGVHMVPVTDNKPYHHVRGIPYLTRLSKKSTVNLMKGHGIDYVILPLTDEQISLIPEQCNCTINNGHLQIPFNKEKVQKIKTNQTLSKLHQPKNSRFPPSFGRSATIPNSLAARWRRQSRMLMAGSSVRHPTARTSNQLSCTGRQEMYFSPCNHHFGRGCVKSTVSDPRDARVW